jgi:hypothetical protein
VIPPPKNLLVSFHYYKNWDLDRLQPCRIIGDSGAFSAKKIGAKVTTRQLAAWTKIWQHRLQWVASLDIAGDVEQTRKNWLRMVNDYQLPAVSTLHVGDDPSEMDWYAEQGVDLLGLGGMAGSNNLPSIQFRWLTKVFRYAQENHPEMRFHGWGITRGDWLRLPFFSCDSSGWGSSYRYGRIKLRHPLQPGKSYALELNGRSKRTFSPEVAELLRDHYGVNPSEIAKSGPSNRMLLVKLSALSASVQEQQWRYQHRKSNITPPKWGHLGGWELPPGPNQHLAMGGCGAGLREIKVMEELHHGPHLHLVDGHPRHIEAVAELARERL